MFWIQHVTHIINIDNKQNILLKIEKKTLLIDYGEFDDMRFIKYSSN